MSRGRGVASILLAVSAASAAGAAWTTGAFSPSPSVVRTPGVHAPLLSPRRVPDAVVGLIADARLAARVDRFIASVGGETCVAVDAGDRPSVRRNDAQPLIPASTMKLLTARSVSESRVTRGATFATSVYGPQPDRDGAVAGDLTLVGAANPLLSTPAYIASLKRPIATFTDINDLAKLLVAKGIRRVTGGIVGDDLQFDRERYVPSWKPDYARDGDVGPIGALVVNDGFTSFGPRPVAAGDPAVHAATLFRQALLDAGVAVAGTATRGGAPAGPPLAQLVGPKLPILLEEMLTESDNNTAEQLAKYADGTLPATRAEGLAELRRTLMAARLPAGDWTAIDGSGLDRGNRATCRLLLAALTPTRSLNLTPMLALAGRTGTLTDRFKGHALEAKLRAKTGSLAGVVGLVGVVDPDAPVPVRFAFLANGSFSEAGGRQLQERLGSVLATYPEAPPPSAVAP